MNIRNPNSHKISQLKVGGKLINNPRDISNKLNEYFVNVGPTTEDSIPKTQNVSALKFMKERINYAFLIAQVSHNESIDKGKYGCGIFIDIYARPLTQLIIKFYL